MLATLATATLVTPAKVVSDLRVGAALLALLVAPPCLAQVDLLPNGSFDKDVSGWAPVEDFMSISFDTDDVDASDESGSARVTLSNFPNESLGFVAQCVAVFPGRSYLGSASFLIPSDQDRVGNAGMRVEWFESSDCSGPSPEFGFGVAFSTVGQWTDLPTVEFLAPDDVFSAEVQLQIDRPVFGTSGLDILYDEVTFVPEPSASLSGLAALIGIAALASRRRAPASGYSPVGAETSLSELAIDSASASSSRRSAATSAG